MGVHAAAGLGHEDDFNTELPPCPEMHVHRGASCAASSWGSLNLGTTGHEFMSSLPEGLPSPRALEEPNQMEGRQVESSQGSDDLDAVYSEDEPAVVVVHRVPSPPQAASVQRPAGVPALDLARVKGCSGSSAPRPLVAAEVQQDGPDDAALCFEASCNRAVRPGAPLVDNRCYVYRAIGPQELARVSSLLSRLQQPEASEVAALWDALLIARRDCEAMASRGVRVARDVSRDWQETVSDLIDRVVAQDGEICGLKQQLQQHGAAAPAPANGAVEELHSQVVRLKRQRDKLTHERQEMSMALQDSQEALAAAQAEGQRQQAALDSARSQARMLREHQVALLRHHMDLVAHAEGLEGELAAMLAVPGAAAAAAAARSGAEGGLPGAAAGMQQWGLVTRSSPSSPAGAAPLLPQSTGSFTSKSGGVATRGGANGGRSTSPWALAAAPPQPAAGAGSAQAGRTNSHDPCDSRAEDQFDQQLAPSAPPQVRLPAKQQQRGRPAGSVPASGAPAFDYRADLEACKQQLELLGGWGV